MHDNKDKTVAFTLKIKIYICPSGFFWPPSWISGKATKVNKSGLNLTIKHTGTKNMSSVYSSAYIMAT